MANKSKTARSSGNYPTPKPSTYSKADMPIISDDFSRGCAWVAVLFVLLFVVLSFGAVVYGW